MLPGRREAEILLKGLPSARLRSHSQVQIL
jgi:hypothetical protein